MSISERTVPRAFVWRRLHSLTGLLFLIFLMEHLFTNSQAAIFFGNNAMWFVNSVNFLHSIPYLPFVEFILLGVPIGLHAIWGVWYMLTSKSNVYSMKGKASSQKHERNKAYSMQRITAWVILVGIIFHVVQMRFVMYPHKIHMGNYSQSFGRYTVDSGLYKVCDDLGVKIYDQQGIAKEKQMLAKMERNAGLVNRRIDEMRDSKALYSDEYSAETDQAFKALTQYNDKKDFVDGLSYFTISPDEVIITSKKSADLILLNVREVFQSLFACILYSIFMAAAVFHGSNGFWTFCITWGLLLSKKSQKSWVSFVYGLAFVLFSLGTLSIWGSYFFNAGFYN